MRRPPKVSVTLPSPLGISFTWKAAAVRARDKHFFLFQM